MNLQEIPKTMEKPGVSRRKKWDVHGDKITKDCGFLEKTWNTVDGIKEKIGFWDDLNDKTDLA